LLFVILNERRRVIISGEGAVPLVTILDERRRVEVSDEGAVPLVTILDGRRRVEVSGEGAVALVIILDERLRIMTSWALSLDELLLFEGFRVVTTLLLGSSQSSIRLSIGLKSSNLEGFFLFLDGYLLFGGSWLREWSIFSVLITISFGLFLLAPRGILLSFLGLFLASIFLSFNLFRLATILFQQFSL